MRRISCLNYIKLWATFLALTRCPLLQTPNAATERNRIEIEATDRRVDPLPSGAIARLGTVRLRNVSRVTFVAFLPDGKKLVAASQEAIRLWDVTTGKEIMRCFECNHGRGIDAAALSSDGKLLVAAESDGDEENGIVHLWDLRSGKELSRRIERKQITSIAFAPDGRRIVAGNRHGVISIWNVQTMNIIRELAGHQGPIRSLAFLPNGDSFISGSEDRSIRIWSIRAGKQIHHVIGHDDEVTSVAVSKDESGFATASTDGTVRLWDAKDFKEIRCFQGDKAPVLAVSFVRDKEILSLSEDHTIRLWSLTTGKELNKARLRDPIFPSALAASLNCNLLAIGDHHGLVCFWDMLKWKEISIASKSHEAEIHGIAFSHVDRRIVTVSRDHTLRSWDFNKGGQCSVAHWDYSTYLALSHDAQVVATLGPSSNDETLTLWDAKTRNLIKEIDCHLRHPHHIAFSKDLKCLAFMAEDDSTDHDNIRLWNMQSHEPIVTIPLGKGGDSSTPLSSTALSFSPDSKLLAHANTAGTIRLWDPQNGRNIKTFKLSERDSPYCLCFSPDSTLLIIGKHDGGIVKYEARTGKLVSTISPVTEGIIESIAVSPDGRFIAAGDNYGELCVLENLSGGLIRRVSGHQSEISCMCFSNDGKYLFTGSEDCTALVWELPRLMVGKAPTKGRLSSGELEQLWSNLRSSDSATAYRSYWTLVRFPDQTVALFKEKLQRVRAVPPDLISRLISQLDSESFMERELATKELGDFGELVRPALVKTLDGKPCLELRARIESLLDHEAPVFHPDRLRELRAIGVLETIHTHDAVAILTTLSKGTADSHVTRDACAALRRLLAEKEERENRGVKRKR